MAAIMRVGESSPAIMMNSVIVRIVDLCARFRWTVIVLGTLLMLGAAAYRRRAIFREYRCRRADFAEPAVAPRQLELSQAFPQKASRWS